MLKIKNRRSQRQITRELNRTLRFLVTSKSRSPIRFINSHKLRRDVMYWNVAVISRCQDEQLLKSPSGTLCSQNWEPSTTGGEYILLSPKRRHWALYLWAFNYSNNFLTLKRPYDLLQLLCHLCAWQFI